MKKSIFLTLAAGFALASCSSDEPGVNTPDNGFSGDTAYLTVNISDVGAAGRADAPDAGNFEFGSEYEHTVDNAKFFFFDADGLYVSQASVWQAGEGTSSPNVEYMGANVLVLKGLTSDTTPNYMLTVLNAPADFQPTQGWTLDYTREQLMAIQDGNDHFVMSTTSYDGDFGKLHGDGSYLYGVNVLTPDDFNVRPYGGSIDEINKAKTVNVYVERLAAKVEVSFSKTTQVNEDGYYVIPVTVAGNLNTEGGDDAGLTEVYVKVSNWGLNHYNEKSYLTKNIADFIGNAPWSNTNVNEIWNSKDYFRSFWGKSYGYDNSFSNGDKLTAIDLNSAKNDFEKNNVAYVAEYNDAAANLTWSNGQLNDNKVTSVVFSAQICEKATDGTYKPLNLVRFDGVLYRQSAFLNHVLSFLQYQNQLPYYKLVSETENKVENPDGTTTSTWEKNYAQMNAADLKLAVAKKVGAGTGIVYVYAADELAGTTCYVKDTEEDKYVEYTITEDDVKTLNENLLKFYNGDAAKSQGEAFNAGNMFYTIPIQHIITPKGTAVTEGNYGVIRNHWYKIEVDQVLNIGHGVFQPGTDDEQGEELTTTEEDKDPTYYLRAQINVLSWRIVNQKVDL